MTGVTCRHCGKFIVRLPGSGFWSDEDGFCACVKSPSPYAADAVLHEPMPDGLAGSVKEVPEGGRLTNALASVTGVAWVS